MRKKIGKLSLSKETIRLLQKFDEEDLARVPGGITTFCQTHCDCPSTGGGTGGGYTCLDEGCSAVGC